MSMTAVCFDSHIHVEISYSDDYRRKSRLVDSRLIFELPLLCLVLKFIGERANPPQ